MARRSSFPKVQPIVFQLASCRQARGLSQQLVADRMGVSRRSISFWELGYTDPRLSHVVAFAEAVGAQVVLETRAVSSG